MSKYYFLFIRGGTEPELSMPFESQELRDDAAKKLWEKEGHYDNNIFGISLVEDGKLSVCSFDLDEEIDLDDLLSMPNDEDSTF